MNRSSRALRVGVDVGGTFTDVVVIDGERLLTAKVPSTDVQSEGVIRGIEASGVDAAAVEVLAHGTTVATNALLERRGAATALLTTLGFRDVIEIARQSRASLYDLGKRRPEPLVPRELRFEARERMTPGGELEPLDEGGVEKAAAAMAAAGVEAVAVCFLFGYLHPSHERRAAEILAERLPGVHVSVSSEVLPEFREYERASTTVCNGYLAPRLERYLSRLSRRASEAGLPAPLVMQSSGGVMDADRAGRVAAACVLSGPAAGVVGAAQVAARSGVSDTLTFDMGGTSSDVAAVVRGEPALTTESVIAGVAIKLPSVDVHTVGAGGGSIAWVDEGGALRVGPQSAGANPGPACYGRGGESATVTDANLYLGYLQDGAVLGGEVVLRRDLAAQAIARLASDLNIKNDDAAVGIVTVAEAEMTRALKVISVERGHDPRTFALVAFGGAGPLHACALAEQLGMKTVLVPRACGVLSALGLALSDLRRDEVHPFLVNLDDADPPSVEDAFRALERRASEELPGSTFARHVDCRYRGQAFELRVPFTNLQELESIFHDAHARRYGYRMDEEPVQIVNLRVTATLPRGDTVLPSEKPGESSPASRRRARIAAVWSDVAVHTRLGMRSGAEIEGPAIVEFPEATCLVRPAWTARLDDVGTMVVERT